MPRPARHRRRSLAPCLDPLEGRKLLSRLAHLVEAPAYRHAGIADQDGGREYSKSQLPYDRSVSTEGPTPGPTVPTRETAGRPRSEPEAYGTIWAGRSKDDDESYPGGTPATKSSDNTKAATVTEPDSLSVFASNAPEGHQQREVGKRWDSLPRFTVTGIAAVTSGTVEHLPAVPERDGEASSASPPTKPESTPRRPRDTGLETEPERDLEMESPRGAGLISQVLPFPGEILDKAVDDVLDQFEDMGVLDAVGEITTGRIAAFGAACVATLGAIEMVRGLHRGDSETKTGRTPSGRMVPGLWPARS